MWEAGALRGGINIGTSFGSWVGKGHGSLCLEEGCTRGGGDQTVKGGGGVEERGMGGWAGGGHNGPVGEGGWRVCSGGIGRW